MMATNINEEVANAYEAAKQALKDDLKQNFYNAAQARMTAFRQINNIKNASHTLYSGAPAAAQMQYDAETYVPGLGTALVKSLEKQEQNQETWDKYMKYVQSLNAQAAQYRKLANDAQIKTNAIAGFINKPTGNINKQNSSRGTNTVSGGVPSDFVLQGSGASAISNNSKINTGVQFNYNKAPLEQ